MADQGRRRGIFLCADSRHVAFIGVPEEKPYYSWSVIDVKTGIEKRSVTFSRPRRIDRYRYFDQLAVSHTIWSPDSSSFIYAGCDWKDRQKSARLCGAAPSAWIVPIDGSKPHAVSNAVLAFLLPAK